MILLTRLPLFNPQGQYFFGDETFYKRLIITLQESKKINDPLLFWQGVFGVYARPGFGIIYSLPILGESQKPTVPYGAMLNIAINCLIPLLVFLILKKLVTQNTAVISTIVIIFSISSVFYIRHMLPYDSSLAILLLALFVYVRSKSIFTFGIISAISFLTYPSYFYYFVPIPFLFFVFNKFRLMKSILFVGGFASIVILAQLVSLLIGAKPSYLEEARYLSGIVVQGDFMPALSFLIEYIFAYDGYVGLIIAGFAPAIIMLWRKKDLRPIIIYLLVIFLLLETFSHIIPKTVLYGRTVRPFYLLLLVSSVITLNSFFVSVSKRLRIHYAIFFSAFVLVLAINWWPGYTSFLNITYPSAVRAEVEIFLESNYGEYKLEDVYTKKRTEVDIETDPPTLESGKFYLANPTLLYPYFGSLDLPCDKEILIEREHPLVFKPYWFEGFTRKMREYLSKDPPKYRLAHCN